MAHTFCFLGLFSFFGADLTPPDGNSELYSRLWDRPWAAKQSSSLGSLNTSTAAAQQPPSVQQTNGDKLPACFGCELEYLMAEMWCGASLSTPISPDHLLQTLWQSSDELAGYLQQDAQEFFSFLVNQLHSHTCQTSTIKPDLLQVVSPSQANKNGVGFVFCVLFFSGPLVYSFCANLLLIL